MKNDVAEEGKGKNNRAKKIPYQLPGKGFAKKIGGDLLSHIVAHAVPSALKSLTSVFGMGTGGSSSL